MAVGEVADRGAGRDRHVPADVLELLMKSELPEKSPIASPVASSRPGRCWSSR